jgi:hypothetical protein
LIFFMAITFMSCFDSAQHDKGTPERNKGNP